MNSLVVYESKFGNTQTVAEAIAKGLGLHGLARVVEVDDPCALTLAAVDLLVIGGPTQAHGLSPAMRAYLCGLIPRALAGTRVAAFDTRLKGPGLLWGSAAKAIAGEFRRAGLLVATTPESFLVEGMKEPKLVDGEEARAEVWATQLGRKVASQQPVTSRVRRSAHSLAASANQKKGGASSAAPFESCELRSSGPQPRPVLS